MMDIDKVVDKLLNEESVVGKKVTFNADSFQVPFDIPDEKEHLYKGTVVKEKSDHIMVKLTSPSFAAGKVIKVPWSEDTLEVY